MGFITDIKESIVTKITDISLVVNSPIQAVFDYDAPETMEKKPAVTISYADHEAELYTTTENSRDLQFLVRVYVSASSNETAEEDIVRCVEDIIQELESDPTLGGLSVNLLCNSATIDTENSTEDIRVANINVLVEIIKAR